MWSNYSTPWILISVWCLRIFMQSCFRWCLLLLVALVAWFHSSWWTSSWLQKKKKEPELFWFQGISCKASSRPWQSARKKLDTVGTDRGAWQCKQVPSFNSFSSLYYPRNPKALAHQRTHAYLSSMSILYRLSILHLSFPLLLFAALKLLYPNQQLCFGLLFLDYFLQTEPKDTTVLSPLISFLGGCCCALQLHTD